MQANMFEDRFRFNIICEDAEHLSENMFNFSLPSNFTIISKKIIYHNTEFKENDVIVFDSDEQGDITALKINFIFVNKSYKSAIFYGIKIKMWYNYNSVVYESYDIEKSYTFANLKDILIRYPVNLYYENKKYYLSLLSSFIDKYTEN